MVPGTSDKGLPETRALILTASEPWASEAAPPGYFSIHSIPSLLFPSEGQRQRKSNMEVFEVSKEKGANQSFVTFQL